MSSLRRHTSAPAARAIDSCLDVLRNLLEPGAGHRPRKRRVGGSLAMTGSASALREARKRGHCVLVADRTMEAKHPLQARARVSARALFVERGEAVEVLGIWKYCRPIEESIQGGSGLEGRPSQAESHAHLACALPAEVVTAETTMVPPAPETKRLSTARASSC